MRKTKISEPAKEALPLVWFHEIRNTIIVSAILIAVFLSTGKPIIMIIWEWIIKFQLLILSVVVVNFLSLLSG